MNTIIIISVLAVILLVCFLSTKNTENIITSSGSSSSGSTTTTYSVKGGVNNPGFLIVSGADWRGKIPPAQGQHFENFDNLEMGIRAWYVNLFNKYKNGIITTTSQMIDVLTPAGSENPENARQNYKLSVSKARTWLELGTAVFNFEANPSWKGASNELKQSSLSSGLRLAIDYCYRGQTPNFFRS